MTVTDLSFQAEGLSSVFKKLGKISAEAAKKTATKVFNKSR